MKLRQILKDLLTETSLLLTSFMTFFKFLMTIFWRERKQKVGSTIQVINPDPEKLFGCIRIRKNKLVLQFGNIKY